MIASAICRISFALLAAERGKNLSPLPRLTAAWELKLTAFGRGYDLTPLRG